MKRVVYGIFVVGICCGLFGFSTVSLAAKWAVKEELPGGAQNRRMYLATSVVGDRLYVIGGHGNVKAQIFGVVEYDPRRDAYTEKDDMSTPRFMHAASTVNGKIYVIGGTPAGNQPTSANDEYDPRTDTWLKKAAMPTPRTMLGTAVVGGRIYAIGGQTDPVKGIPSGAVEVYDPRTNTWEKKTDMPTPRWDFAIATVSSRIYVIGGAVGGGALGTESTNTVEEYNTRTDTWTRKADLWLDLSGLSGGFVNNGKIYVVGGHKKRGEEHNGRGIKKFSWTVYKSLSAYDTATDTWEQLENMPTERWAFGANVMDGKLYVIGGATGNLFPLTTITEVYTPDGWPFPDTFSVSSEGKLATMWAEIKRRQ